MNKSRDERFDNMFLAAIQQLGSVEKFFDTLFGFVGHKTDLFTQPENTTKMINTFLKFRVDEFQKSKAAQDKVKQETAAHKARIEAERQEQEKKHKYFMDEKLKMENEKRAKQGLPPLVDPAVAKAQEQ